MPALSDDLAATAAPLEYWFIKLHAGDLAFLVDFIARRRSGRAEVRVSLWVRGEGRVARTVTTSWSARAATVAVGGCELTAAASRGAVEDIEWDLTLESDGARAAPSVPVLSKLGTFDLDLVSHPRTLVGGHVTVSGERFDLVDVRGSVTHYWGRRLPQRWHWISANAFGGDLTVEAVVLRTRLWNQRPTMTAGYLWTYENGRERMLISPLTGLISISGSPYDYTLVARGRQGGRIHCTSRPEQYNDLGEGIHQTLLGSCALLGRGLTDTRAGLEYRIEPQAADAPRRQ